MIKVIDNLEEYSSFILSIKEDTNYWDPMLSTKEQIKANLYNAVDKKDNIVLGVSSNNVIIGLFVFLVLKDEKYVEMIVGLSKSKKAYDEVFEYIALQYSGFQVDFVFNPGNAILKEILVKKKASFEKELQKLVLSGKVDFENGKHVELYSDKYKQQYICLHNKDMYWTGDRVIEASNKFRTILAIENEMVVGYIDVTKSFAQNEIYDLFVEEEHRKKGLAKELISMATTLNESSSMMVLVNVDNYDEISLYESVGFAKIKHQNNITAHLVI